MKLPHPSPKHIALVILGIALIYIPIALLSFLFYSSQSEIDSLRLSYSEVKEAQNNFKQNLSEDLFNEHLALQGKQNLENELAQLEEEIETIRESPEGSVVANITDVYELYGSFQAKLTRNENAKLDTEGKTDKLDDWGTRLINQEFEEVLTEISEANAELDETYDEYLATLPPPPPPPSSGYTYTTVNTEKGSHAVYLIKLPLSQVRVKTAAASGSDCGDNCPTKSLEQFVKDNGAFAAINGSYFCPPDYSNCSGKINSFDYAFYHSSGGKWLNKGALSWGDTGLMTFKGNSAKFYKKSSEYGGGSVDAGISNYPSLLKDGEVVIKSSTLTSFQKIKGTRGVLGVGGENIYLALVTGATVEEAAYAIRALGAKHALNIDGGGSSAMYIDGRYVVGPGRSLPNAILLVK